MFGLRSSRLLVLLVCTAPLPCGIAQDDAGDLRWEEFQASGQDGTPLTGRLGRIRVPENRAKEDSATIEIAFVVYESSNDDPGPPIFFLIGGPGAPGVDFTADEATNPMMPLLEFGDVIGIDQRGTGHSKPNLSSGGDFSYQLPMDEPLTRDAVIAAQSDSIRRCYEYWTEQGVDLAAYNSRESADDVDAVRRALGYDKIITWGTSYGSHLSLAYLRRHAEHVERAVLMKVEGPDHTFKLPSRVQQQLELVHERIAADAGIAEHLPDFLGTVAALREQLEEQPVKVTLQHPSGDIDIIVGPLDLQLALAMQVAHTSTLARIPAVIHAVSNGDWTMIGMAGLNLRHGGSESAMPFMMDYSSGATPSRLARIEGESKDPENLLSDALNFPYFPDSAAACGNPDLGDDFRGPLRCEVPTLFVSGDLDARTPPSNVEDILHGFSDHVHVLVEGTGHDSRELQSEEYRDLIGAFLRGEKVESRTIELPPVEFMPIRE